MVAARRSLDTPVDEIVTVPASVTLSDYATLGRRGPPGDVRPRLHHCPVVDAAGALVGVVTDTDLMGLGRHTPFAIAQRDRARADRRRRCRAGPGLPARGASAGRRHADPSTSAAWSALVVDALTRTAAPLWRSSAWASPPCSWAWLALGSAARQEQALLTDQDHALAYDGPPSVDADPSPTSPSSSPPAWSRPASPAARATRWPCTPRCDGRSTTGSARCVGTGWTTRVPRAASCRRSSSTTGTWRARWTRRPPLDAVVREARCTRTSSSPRQARARPGPADRLLPRPRRRGQGRARRAARREARRHHDHHEPRASVRDGRGSRRTAHDRASARRAGRRHRRPWTAQELAEAFRFLWEIRLTHQVAQVRAGEPPDDFVDPHGLGPVARTGLKEAFRVITRAQRSLALDLGVRPP